MLQADGRRGTFPAPVHAHSVPPKQSVANVQHVAASSCRQCPPATRQALATGLPSLRYRERLAGDVQRARADPERTWKRCYRIGERTVAAATAGSTDGDPRDARGARPGAAHRCGDGHAATPAVAVVGT